MVEKLRYGGLITVGAGENVVRLLPPLIITEQQIGEAVQIIDKVAGQWKL
jgi:acetylornithine/N-succinyldiaminopimelate aminotransferase